MESYTTNEAALNIACRLYVTDAFGFLRRVMLILVAMIFRDQLNNCLTYCRQEIAAPRHQPVSESKEEA